MSAGAVLLLGAGLGIGLLAIWRGLYPPRPPLARALAALGQAPPDPGGEDRANFAGASWSARLARPMVPMLTGLGLPRRSVQTDLMVCDKAADVHIAEQAALGIAGALLPAAATAAAALGGTVWPWPVPAWAGLVLGACGLCCPDWLLGDQARRLRADFTYALAAWLDVTVIGLAGGAGIEQAISQAAAAGHGQAHTRLRHAIDTAQATRVPLWQPLTDLAAHLNIPALAELAAALRLAGDEGARIRASLTARATTLRLRQLTAAEADANAATERMSLPVVLLLLAFLLLIGYPAVTAVLTGL